MSHDVCELGYFCSKDSESIRIQYPGDNVAEYKVLKWNDFDAKRKCASVVVRGPDGRTFAYVKGSDTTLFKM